MIDFDVTTYPTGVRAWQDLLAAIENANKGDETEWIEFKANLDLTKKVHRPVAAKTIVAFANRDPLRAARYLEGRALLVVGLEPGNVVGTAVIDPADLHNYLQPYLASTQPCWDHQYLTYKGADVLVITVDPPRPGDPIHCISTEGEGVRDGDVYIRKVGQSAKATSADLAMLTRRLLANAGTEFALDVTASADGPIAMVGDADDWCERWIDTERARLMEPLNPTPTRSVPISDAMARQVRQAVATVERFEALNPMMKRREETRDREEYEAEVASYLNECRDGLQEAVAAIRHAVATPVNFTVENPTAQNLSGVELKVHIDADIEALDERADFVSLSDYLPRPPRIWGPWTQTLSLDTSTSLINMLGGGGRGPIQPMRVSYDEPDIDYADDGVTVTFPPRDLRPHATEHLHEVYLVGSSDVGGELTCMWTATATNRDGKIDGTITLPARDPADPSDLLANLAERERDDSPES